ncbi:hypothetical protein BDV59DRAFT_171402 [Aspergillus ambiguus]|uniref:uncharacterized protein n=1 Tax=Aspergillus ambiguus TaxID=176160 RepID=UPI003CCD8656
MRTGTSLGSTAIDSVRSWLAVWVISFLHVTISRPTYNGCMYVDARSTVQHNMHSTTTPPKHLNPSHRLHSPSTVGSQAHVKVSLQEAVIPLEEVVSTMQRVPGPTGGRIVHDRPV